MNQPRPVLVLSVLCTLLIASGGVALAQSSAAVVLDGRALDVATGEPLAGARVLVNDGPIETSTDREGTFRFVLASAGSLTLKITYLGRADWTRTLTVEPGAVLHLGDIPIGAIEENVVVVGTLLRDASARALNQQKSAPNITNVVSADQIGAFPDRNAAETTQRVVGVSITKDQGEGRYVSVRGTEARLNAMMIDGQRIPSPDPLLRQVAVDVVPSELLQAIEVSKALTPDVDGDSIGGSVNLVTKQAPDKARLLGSIGGGFNRMLSDWGQSNATATAGRRFRGGTVGFIGSFSESATKRGNQDVEVTYTPALGLNELNPRYYQVNRKRVGASGALDVRPGPGSGLTFRGMFNRFIDDHENRQRVRWLVGNSRIDRELRDRTHIERIASLGVNGHSLIGGSSTLDYEVSGGYSDQYDPLTMTTTFRESRVTFAPNVTATSIDPDNVQANPLNDDPNSYNFQQQIRATNYANDRDVVAVVNLRRPLTSSTSSTSFLKAGMKFRDKRKGRDRNETNYSTAAALPMRNFVETGFGDLPPYLGGRYDLQPYLSQSLVAGIPNLAPMTVAVNHQRDAENFDGTERTSAAYAMAEIYAGKLYLLPGLRYEYTTADFVGRDVRFAPNGAWLSSDPLRATTSYGIPLPGFHVKYAATPDTNIRFAVTRSLARPNYYDAVPYRAQDDNALTIALGTADLRPTKSWNVDLLGEHYFNSVGVVSAGVFYKRLQDYIYGFTSTQIINGSQYQVTQPLNGDAATVRGAEVALQNQLRFLPAPFDGLGVYANYTFTTSSAAIPGHLGATLPGQSRHMGNIAASYEKGGFSGRVAVNFHGSYVDVIGATNALDRYYDRSTQLDMSLSQKVARNLRLYVDGINLNDALLRYYQGLPERVLQEEHYRWSTTFGVKVEF
ncbi:MAG TPA: TonB-dependent receptor [Vicinamibacterales bacterium]|nr:TonB-dependent receptor [Vicinamibacterales bacterium]